jgi:hypothetical protein
MQRIHEFVLNHTNYVATGALAAGILASSYADQWPPSNLFALAGGITAWAIFLWKTSKLQRWLDQENARQDHENDDTDDLACTVRFLRERLGEPLGEREQFYVERAAARRALKLRR